MTEFANEMTELAAEGLRPVNVAKVNWTNDTRRMDDTVVVDEEDPSWIHKDEATVAEGMRNWRRHIDDVIGYEYPDEQLQDDQLQDHQEDQDPSWIHKDEATVAEGMRNWRRNIDDVIGYEYPDEQLQDEQLQDHQEDQDPSWIHKDEATVAEGMRNWRRNIDDVIGYEYPDEQLSDDQEDEIIRAIRKEWDEEDAHEEANPWTEMVHDDELYYVNSDRTLWYKSSDMSPYPRKYYPGMEEKVDYEDSPKVFTYVGGRG